MARLLRLALGRLVEDVPGEDAGARPAIVALLRGAGVLAAQEREPDDLELVAALRAAIADESRPGLANVLRQLGRVASHLRERLSLDNWRVLNRMGRPAGRLEGRGQRAATLSDVLVDLDATIAAFTTLSGFALDGMTRDPGWRFLSVGRRIERMQNLCTNLRQALAGPPDADLTWLLRLADSIITYRARYSSRPEWLPVLDLLVRDEANPRSIAFQVTGLLDYVRRLRELFGDVGEEGLEGPLAGLRALDPGVDLRHGSERLGLLLEDCYAAGHRLGEQLGHRFFSHVGEASRQTFAT
jgi:uncharacterized alpha-E superfamily protein